MTALIFLDTETCGLGLDDPIWEIALIRRERDGVETRHEFFVQHDTAAAEALPEQFRADHDSRYDPAAAWPLDKLATVLGYLLRDRPHVVGAVPDFDTYRIQRQLGVSGWHYHLIDVENLAAGWLAGKRTPPAPPWDSDALSDAIGINPEQFARHTAMGDVLWAKAIYDRVMGVTR